MPRATFPPVEDVARFDLRYTSNDGVALVNCLNTLYVHRDIGWSVADMIATADDIRAAWASDVAPLVQTEYILTEIAYKNLDNPLNPTGVHTFTAVPGTAVGDPVPFTSSATVRFNTSGLFPTTCYIRHGGIVESQVDGMHLSTAAVTSITSAWTAVSNAITNVNDDHVCIQVYNPGGSGATLFKDAGTFEDVQAVVVRRRLGTSVSRKK